MNPFKYTSAKNKGSALITVVALIFAMAMLSASFIGYSLFEQRMNERTRLALRSENAAENISLYAAEQLTAKLQRMGSPSVGHFPWTGPSTNTLVVYMPPASATGTDNVLVSEYSSAADVANMEVRAGIEAKSDYALVTDTTSPNNGMQVATANVPIIAKGIAKHPALGALTTYVEQDMQLTLLPLFQFGMFYNMDLELYPSGDMTLTGPVHTNKSFLAHADSGSSITLDFTDRVTATDYIFAYQAAKCFTRGGSGAFTTGPSSSYDPTAGAVKFTDATSTATPKTEITMKSNGNSTTYPSLANNLWADCRWGDTTRNLTTALPTASQLLSFSNWATATYHGNLSAQVRPLALPGIGGYKETNDPSTPEDDRSNGRQIIESPNHKRYDGSAFTATNDSADLKLVKISWRAGLYIMVNPSDTSRSGLLPDGTTTITLLPRSYRCWLNTRSGSSRSCTEVVLPGQPSYGDTNYPNLLPNRLVAGTATSVGSNQVLRTIQQTYGSGSGYLLNMTPALGNTAITVSTGTGTILAGDIVTIGNYNYLVTSDLSSGIFNIASPGLVGASAPSNGTAVTVNAPANNLGTTNTTYTLGASHSAGTNTITLTQPGTGTGIFLPGSTITMGTNKYLVTAAPVVAPNTTTYKRLYIAAPGILGATLSSGASVTVDTRTQTLGTAANYVVNGTPAVGATTLPIGSGAGTLLPGNIIALGTAATSRYLVTSIANSATDTTALTSVTITPGLTVAPATGTAVFVDPYNYSGYATTGNGGSGKVYPADASTTPYAAEAYFYDIRRANNNGAMGSAGTSADFNRSGTTPYTPRPIAKIDFDMARFKMMVSRVISGATTSSSYRLTLPDTSGTGWGNCIYNDATTTTTTALGLGAFDSTVSAATSYSAASCFPDSSHLTRQNPFGLYTAPITSAQRDAVFNDPTAYEVTSSGLSAAWDDGIAIYIHSVDAEVRAQTTAGIADRVDSGVRLWNGRGPVASLASPNTGFTLATNDATYIIGHFNANGTINSTLSSTGFGGYSSKYPDSSSEFLCSVYGDATTIMSQPTYTQSGAAGTYTYAQSDGWCDAYSALPNQASSDNWDTAAAGSYDGVYNASTINPGPLPTTNKPGTLGSDIRTKFSAVPTEVSTALVIGIVPSNHNPAGLSDRPPSTVANNVNSGGANNFPRFLENWGDTNPLYIRGSMVALFESRVAMEPFTHSRCYNRPLRKWGLHDDLSRANHHVPLEPIVYSADRLGFRQLTPAVYAARKATIEGWTELVP